MMHTSRVLQNDYSWNLKAPLNYTSRRSKHWKRRVTCNPDRAARLTKFKVGEGTTFLYT